MIEKKHRIEDALEAVKSAQQEGVVSGGGVTLAHIGKSLKIKTEVSRTDAWSRAVKFALMEPFLMMCENSGFDKSDMISKLGSLEDNTFGINFNNGELVNLTESGVVDPAKVSRCALQNAASVAGILITTNFFYH